MEKLKAAVLYLMERILFIIFVLVANGFYVSFTNGKNNGPDVYPQLKHRLFALLFHPVIFRRFCFYLGKHLKYLQLHIVE
jgi:hypothetical protein